MASISRVILEKLVDWIEGPEQPIVITGMRRTGEEWKGPCVTVSFELYASGLKGERMSREYRACSDPCDNMLFVKELSRLEAEINSGVQPAVLVRMKKDVLPYNLHFTAYEAAVLGKK